MLGGQVVITIIAGLFLRKLPMTFSQRWILSGLYFYRCPTDEELKSCISDNTTDTNASNKTTRKRSKRYDNSVTSDGSDKNTFSFPKSTPVILFKERMEDTDILGFKFYVEFKWLMDYSLMVILVTLCTAGYVYFFPHRASNEFNLSIVWLMIGCGFVIKLLFDLAAAFFQDSSTSTEAFICVISGLIFFLASMFFIILVPSHYTDFKFDESTDLLSQSMQRYFSNDSLPQQSIVGSRNCYKLSLGVFSGLLATFLTFPTLRFAKTHSEALLTFPDNQFDRLKSNCNLITTLAVSLLFIRPLSRDVFIRNTLSSDYPHIFNDEVYNWMIVAFVLLVVVIRVASLRFYIQAYLESISIRLKELSQEAGFISNIEYRKYIARMNYYTCVVAIQILAPFCLLLYLTLLLAVLGSQQSPDVTKSSPKLTLKHIWKLVPAQFYRSLFGYMIWFISSAYTILTAIGIMIRYQR